MTAEGTTYSSLPFSLQCCSLHGHSLVLNMRLGRTSNSSGEVCQHLGVCALPPRTTQASTGNEKNLDCPTSCQCFYLGQMLVHYPFSQTNTHKKEGAEMISTEKIVILSQTANGILECIKKTVAGTLKEVFLPLCSACGLLCLVMGYPFQKKQ